MNEVVQKVTLKEWAASRFSQPPHEKTLRRWARELLIFPPPKKVGRTYYVEPTAEYMDYRRVS